MVKIILLHQLGLWNYYRDEIDNVEDNASDVKSFKYKTNIIGKTEVTPA